MKLKLDENGLPELKDGQPVYVHDDGKEVAIDVPAMQLRIGQLNEEAKNHRLEATEATEKLAGFEGIDAADASLPRHGHQLGQGRRQRQVPRRRLHQGRHQGLIPPAPSTTNQRPRSHRDSGGVFCGGKGTLK